jgi:biotin carboxyl carrier protein
MFRAMKTSHNSFRVEIAGTQLIATSTEYGLQFDGDDEPVSIIDGERLRSFIGLLPNGDDVPIYVDESDLPHEYTVYIRGEAITVRVVTHRDERLLALRKSAAGSGSSHQIVTAPMPGMLKQMLVSEGQTVSKGETLCILEAMKMENEIKAPARLVVERVIANDGTAVEKGAPLLSLRPDA